MLRFLGNKNNFRGIIAIPHVNSPESGLTEEDLQRWQHELLCERLGINTYREFINHVDDTSGVWYDLLNGGWYSDAASNWHYWNGLVNQYTGLGIIMYYCRLMYAKEYFVNSGRGDFASIIVGKQQKPVPFYNLGVIGEKLCNESIMLNKFMIGHKALEDDFAPYYTSKKPLNIIDNAYGI